MKLLIIFLAQISLSICGVFVQKLTWTESAKSKMIKTGKWGEYNKNQENLRAMSLANVQKRNIQQRFMYHLDSEYVIIVTIGTPPQEFKVHFVTECAEFWIPSIKCKKFPCQEKHRFNPSNSSTHTKVGGKWKLQYSAGRANGIFGEDTVRFGAKNNTLLTIPQLIIGEATEIPSFLQNHPFDGVLGFAFQAMSPHQYSPVFMEAYKRKLVDEPIFTVYYEKRGKQNGADGGQITFGGVDTDHCGEVTYINLTLAALWEFTVDRVQMAGSSYEGPFEVFSNTGSSSISGPLDIISSMLQKISAQKFGEFWYVDCATTATFDITIGGKVYSIQPENYILDQKIDDKCSVAIIDSDRLDVDGFAFVLGAPFFRQFCHIHDMGKKRIGFATILGRASSDK